MNFKLKSNWKEETLALNHFEKENWAKTFGAVVFTQSQTSRSFQSKKNRLLVLVIVLTHWRYFLTRSLRSSLFLVGFKTEVVISSSFVLSSFVNESKI